MASKCHLQTRKLLCLNKTLNVIEFFSQKNAFDNANGIMFKQRVFNVDPPLIILRLVLINSLCYLALKSSK